MNRRIRWALLALVLVAAAGGLALRWRAVRRTNDQQTRLRVLVGANVAYVLTPERAEALPGPLSDTFDVAPGGDVVLASGQRLVSLTPDGDASGLTWTDLEIAGPLPSSFAIDSGALLGIAGRFLGRREEDGRFSQAVPLPFEHMKLAASSQSGRVYLFGGDATTHHRVYAFDEDGGLVILAELPAAIVAVADGAGAIYVATAAEIYRIDGEPALVFRAPDDLGPLVSIAVTPGGGALIFSTTSRLHALRGLAAIALVVDLGGHLRTEGDDLYVWDQPRRLLVRLGGVEEVLLAGGTR